MTAAETNPLIEEVLAGNGVVPDICRMIHQEVAEDRDLARLLGWRDEDDFLARLRVSYRERVLHPWEEIRDAVGVSLNEKLRFDGAQAILLLIDPLAGANWAHPCWIATYDIDHKIPRFIANDFPPQETADRRLVPYQPRTREQ